MLGPPEQIMGISRRWRSVVPRHSSRTVVCGGFDVARNTTITIANRAGYALSILLYHTALWCDKGLTRTGRRFALIDTY